jgi:hypothetical protein
VLCLLNHELLGRSQRPGNLPFPHPGDTIREVYREVYLKPLGADTALRLGRYFNTTPRFWLNLQASYDLALASEARSEEIHRTVHPREAA